MQYRIRDLYWEMRLQTGSRYDKIGFNQKLKGDGMMESYMQMLAKQSPVLIIKKCCEAWHSG